MVSSRYYKLGKNHQATWVDTFFCTLRRVLAMWLLDVALGKTLLPGWFAMGSLPVLHGSAALAIKQLLPVMQTSGLPIAQALATSVVGNPLDPSKLALSAVLASMVMHLGTFYTFLTVASLDGKGIDNANPRETQRAISGSLKGRLLAAHQNQVRLVLSSPRKPTLDGAVPTMFGWCTNTLQSVCLIGFGLPYRQYTTSTAQTCIC